jgi:hypothetical protein
MKLAYGEMYCFTFWHRVGHGAEIALKARSTVIGKVPSTGEWQKFKTTVAPPSKYDDELRMFVSVATHTAPLT